MMICNAKWQPLNEEAKSGFIFGCCIRGLQQQLVCTSMVCPKIIEVTGHLKYVIPGIVIFNWSDLKLERNERIFPQTSHFHFDDGTRWSDIG